MIDRAKKIGATVARALADPRMMLALPHDARAALADISAELIELNQRLEKLERAKDGGDDRDG